MSCQPCTTNNTPATLQSFRAFYNECGCADCNDCGCNGVTVDTRCVVYTGPNLPCAQIETNQTLEDILIKIDQKICTAVGNYASYNKYCIDDAGAITTEKDFVEAISSFACTLKSDFDTFKNTTYVNDATALDTRFDAIESPNITCSSAGVISTDSLNTVLTKYCSTFSDIYSKISLSGVAWDSCYTVNPDPVTIAEGFNTLIGQICDIKNSGVNGILPTFNNEGSCLPSPVSASDSLVTTISKIKERLCETPTFDIDALTWGCTTKPDTTTTDLQAAFDAVLAQLTFLKQNSVSFSSDFTVALTDSEDPCEGKTISLAPSGLEDKYVTVSGADATPGTLAQKLIAGDGIELDITTTPGTMIINVTDITATSPGTVKMRIEDPTAGYLKDKIEGSTASSGISIAVSPNTSNEKVSISAQVNFEDLWNNLLTYLDENPSMATQFCQRVTDCLPDCIVPPNVTVIYQDTNQTTTSTTTTTTTTSA
jgi:hypothetical protein